MTRKPQKNKTNWQGIERDYTHGDMSVRQIADWYGITEGAVRARAKKHGWARPDGAPTRPVKKRDLSVTYTVRETIATRETTDPKEIIRRGQNLALQMLDELTATTSRVDELEVLITEATETDESSRRLEAMMRAISLPSRANTLKALAQALKTLVDSSVPAGKKAAAQEAAENIGKSSPGWGNDLVSPLN